VAFAEFCRPIRAQRFYPIQQPVAARKLDGMTLPIIEAEHFDAGKALERPCETGGGVLSAGEQHQRGVGLRSIVHGRALSTHRSKDQSVEIRWFRWERRAGYGIKP
jgi:hypothetical protein